MLPAANEASVTVSQQCIDERLALRQTLKVLIQIGIFLAPVQVGRPEIEVTERATASDIGEREVIRRTPVLGGEPFRHSLQAVVNFALLARHPSLVTLPFLALGGFQANQNGGVEHAVGE